MREKNLMNLMIENLFKKKKEKTIIGPRETGKHINGLVVDEEANRAQYISLNNWNALERKVVKEWKINEYQT